MPGDFRPVQGGVTAPPGFRAGSIAAGIKAEAGTRDAARLLGVDAEVGTLEAGKVADVVAVPGNVLADIHATEHPLFVMHLGRIVVGKMGN